MYLINELERAGMGDGNPYWFHPLSRDSASLGPKRFPTDISSEFVQAEFPVTCLSNVALLPVVKSEALTEVSKSSE